MLWVFDRLFLDREGRFIYDCKSDIQSAIYQKYKIKARFSVYLPDKNDNANRYYFVIIANTRNEQLYLSHLENLADMLNEILIKKGVNVNTIKESIYMIYSKIDNHPDSAEIIYNR